MMIGHFLLSQLNELRLSATLCDLELLSAEGIVFPIHGLVFTCLNKKHFENAHMKETASQHTGIRRMVLSKLSTEEVSIMVDFLYGKISINRKRFTLLKKALDSLNMGYLLEKAEVEVEADEPNLVKTEEPAESVIKREENFDSSSDDFLPARNSECEQSSSELSFQVSCHSRRDSTEAEVKTESAEGDSILSDETQIYLSDDTLSPGKQDIEQGHVSGKESPNHVYVSTSGDNNTQVFTQSTNGRDSNESDTDNSIQNHQFSTVFDHRDSIGTPGIESSSLLDPKDNKGEISCVETAAVIPAVDMCSRTESDIENTQDRSRENKSTQRQQTIGNIESEQLDNSNVSKDLKKLEQIQRCITEKVSTVLGATDAISKMIASLTGSCEASNWSQCIEKAKRNMHDVSCRTEDMRRTLMTNVSRNRVSAQTETTTQLVPCHQDKGPETQAVTSSNSLAPSNTKPETQAVTSSNSVAPSDTKPETQAVTISNSVAPSDTIPGHLSKIITLIPGNSRVSRKPTPPEAILAKFTSPSSNATKMNKTHNTTQLIPCKQDKVSETQAVTSSNTVALIPSDTIPGYFSKSITLMPANSRVSHKTTLPGVIPAKSTSPISKPTKLNKTPILTSLITCPTSMIGAPRFTAPISSTSTLSQAPRFTAPISSTSTLSQAPRFTAPISSTSTLSQAPRFTSPLSCTTTSSLSSASTPNSTHSENSKMPSPNKGAIINVTSHSTKSAKSTQSISTARWCKSRLNEHVKNSKYADTKTTCTSKRKKQIITLTVGCRKTSTKKKFCSGCSMVSTKLPVTSGIDSNQLNSSCQRNNNALNSFQTSVGFDNIISVTETSKPSILSVNSTVNRDVEKEKQSLDGQEKVCSDSSENISKLANTTKKGMQIRRVPEKTADTRQQRDVLLPDDRHVSPAVTTGTMEEGGTSSDQHAVPNGIEEDKKSAAKQTAHLQPETNKNLKLISLADVGISDESNAQQPDSSVVNKDWKSYYQYAFTGRTILPKVSLESSNSSNWCLVSSTATNRGLLLLNSTGSTERSQTKANKAKRKRHGSTGSLNVNQPVSVKKKKLSANITKKDVKDRRSAEFVDSAVHVTTQKTHDSSCAFGFQHHSAELSHTTTTGDSQHHIKELSYITEQARSAMETKARELSDEEESLPLSKMSEQLKNKKSQHPESNVMITNNKTSYRNPAFLTEDLVCKDTPTVITDISRVETHSVVTDMPIMRPKALDSPEIMRLLSAKISIPRCDNVTLGIEKENEKSRMMKLASSMNSYLNGKIQQPYENEDESTSINVDSGSESEDESLEHYLNGSKENRELVDDKPGHETSLSVTVSSADEELNITAAGGPQSRLELLPQSYNGDVSSPVSQKVIMRKRSTKCARPAVITSKSSLGNHTHHAREDHPTSSQSKNIVLYEIDENSSVHAKNMF